MISNGKRITTKKLRGCICLFLICSSILGYAALDVDMDGMSDVWEKRYQAEALLPMMDEDGDGQTNAEESLAGTDPFQSDSLLEFTFNEYRQNGIMLSWDSTAGGIYQVELSHDLGHNWVPVGNPIGGNGGEITAVVKKSGALAFYRVSISSRAEFFGLPAAAETIAEKYDTDEDGLSDLREVRLGLNPLDPNSVVPPLRIARGDGYMIGWESVKGKTYYVEEVVQGGEANLIVGGPYIGNGGLLSASIINQEASSNLTITAVDSDTDGDGLTDWEELQVGLNPEIASTDPLSDGDYAVIEAKLRATDILTVKASRAVANITRMELGGFVVERSGGVGELTVNYIISGSAVAGSDYQELSGVVILPFGENSVEIPVKPLAGATMSLSESVILTLRDSSTYDLGPKSVQQVNVLKEIVINVKDFGAVGDGLADDTEAIQLAIEALEDDDAFNTLYFPSGRYRLASISADFDSPFGWKRLLKMGYRKNLDGRDLIIKGDAEACLYSEVSPERVNMFIIRAGFRSLSVEGLYMEQDSVPLAASPGTEPNFSDALTISANGLQVIEGLYFRDCKFVNCHRAISIYGNGYDIRGYGGRFEMINCRVLNPYGANTEDSVSAWGGGQQIFTAAWVAEAHYENCVFDGGSPNLTDDKTSPGGKIKDGCHFGSPMRLVFRNNTVLRMGVEAVHQTNETTLMGRTLEAFLMPPPDDVARVSVKVNNLPSTWVSGESVNIRTPGTPGVGEANNRLTIRGFDEINGRVWFSNPGASGNVPEGTEIRSGRTVYLDERSEPTDAVIEGNFFEGVVPSGGRAFTGQAAIVSQARAKIINNVIVGYGTGVLSRPVVHTPSFPAAYGMEIGCNFIVTRKSLDYPEVYSYGIKVAGGSEKIYDNLVICPVSWKTAGIAAQAPNTLVWRNTVLADEIMVNGYYSSARTTGIGNGYGANELIIWKNFTRGFDVGVGSLGSSGWASFKCCDHVSILDYVAIQRTNRIPCE